MNYLPTEEEDLNIQQGRDAARYVAENPCPHQRERGSIVCYACVVDSVEFAERQAAERREAERRNAVYQINKKYIICWIFLFLLRGPISAQEPEKLSYTWIDTTGVVIRFDSWTRAIAPKVGKRIFARLNQIDAEGFIIRTVAGDFVPFDILSVEIPERGFWKIALFREGEYCNGIEYDFRFFGQNDFTPIHLFTHHSILCE